MNERPGITPELRSVLALVFAIVAGFGWGYGIGVGRVWPILVGIAAAFAAAYLTSTSWNPPA